MPPFGTDETAEEAGVLAQNFAEENLPYLSFPKRGFKTF
jgi:hypothetical protein